MSGSKVAADRPDMSGSKVFKDPVHGEIELHPLCVKIVDTPEFQRMRFIKQLGGCYFLYQGASHNRFEHCIGVCHLAGKLVKAIVDRLPEDDKKDEKRLDKKMLCVKIAGLCHDLGHGPFSHMFETFVNKIRKEKCQEECQKKGEECKKESHKKWKHEDASLKLVDRIYAHLKKDFEDLGGLEPTDVDFIKELIHPSKELYENVKESGDKQKMKDYFLYEIVANETYGVDVDKWDYFARDCLHLGVKNSFDHGRLIASARACVDKDGVRHVAYRDKDIENVYEMFHIRFTLHRKAYQHRVGKVVEMMIGDAMELTNDETIVEGGKGIGDAMELTNDETIVEDGKGIGDATEPTNDEIIVEGGKGNSDTMEPTNDETTVAGENKIGDAMELTNDETIVEDGKGIGDATEPTNDEIIVEGGKGNSDTMEPTNDETTVAGENKKYKMTDTPNDMEAYIKLSDEYVLHSISDSKCEEAKKLVNRIYTRDLYKFVGEKGIETQTPEKVINEIVANKEGTDIKHLLRVDIAHFDYGAKAENPVEKAYFYTKDDIYNAKHPGEVVYFRRMMIPKHFDERVARVFCTDAKHVDEAKRLVNAWIGDRMTKNT